METQSVVRFGYTEETGKIITAFDDKNQIRIYWRNSKPIDNIPLHNFIISVICSNRRIQTPKKE